jgi:hypothetical protein
VSLAKKLIAPLVPAYRIAALATTFPAGAFMVEIVGLAKPVPSQSRIPGARRHDSDVERVSRRRSQYPAGTLQNRKPPCPSSDQRGWTKGATDAKAHPRVRDPEGR